MGFSLGLLAIASTIVGARGFLHLRAIITSV